MAEIVCIQSQKQPKAELSNLTVIKRNVRDSSTKEKRYQWDIKIPEEVLQKSAFYSCAIIQRTRISDWKSQVQKWVCDLQVSPTLGFVMVAVYIEGSYN